MEMKRLTRRDFLRLSAAAATGAMIMACQATATPLPLEKEAEERPMEEKPAAPAERPRLLYQDWGGETYPQAWQEVGHIFTEAHPNVEVEYRIRPEDCLAKLMGQFVAGTAPDVFETCGADSRFLWDMGNLLALDPYVEKSLSEEDMKDVPAHQMAFWRAPDTDDLYGWPKYQGHLMIFINLDMAEEVGVTYPRTWDEAWSPQQYRQALRKLTRGEPGQSGRIYGGGRIPWSDRNTPFLLSNGAHFVNPDDDTECWLGRPEAQEVLEFWWVLRWEDHSMPNPAEEGEEVHLRSQFPARKIATVEEGSWALKEMSELCPFPWDVAPLYHWPGGACTLATSDGWHIWKGTESPDAAWELMRFLSGPVYSKAIAKTDSLQPARLSLMDDYLKILRQEKPPLEKVNLEILKEARERDLGYPMELYWRQSVAEDILKPVFQQVFELGRAGVDAIAQACEEVTERLRAEKAQAGGTGSQTTPAPGHADP